MPVAPVYMYRGKSTEQMRELAKRISRDFDEVVGVKPESLDILFHDMDKADWGTRGLLGSDGPPR